MDNPIPIESLLQDYFATVTMQTRLTQPQPPIPFRGHPGEKVGVPATNLALLFATIWGFL